MLRVSGADTQGNRDLETSYTIGVDSDERMTPCCNEVASALGNRLLHQLCRGIPLPVLHSRIIRTSFSQFPEYSQRFGKALLAI